MRVVVIGAGLVGTRAAQMLARSGEVDVVLVSTTRHVAPISGVQTLQGWPHAHVGAFDIAVLATESTRQLAIARTLVDQGTSLISTADNPAVVKRLCSLERRANDRGAKLIVGAAYSPGVSTMLAAMLVASFDQVTSIRTAQFGTGGPTCAREHHRANSATAWEVRNGELGKVRGGSGRELVWFPEPIGAADCYRAGLVEPFLLHRAFPEVARVQSRQAATRRDRLTTRLPMLRPPHPEGLEGAVWAEVSGVIKGRVEHRALAASGAQATGAAAMASGWCLALAAGAKSGANGVCSGLYCVPKDETMVSMATHMANYLGLWAYDGGHIVAGEENVGNAQIARKWGLAARNR